jgi:hypothetical protein
MSTASNEAPSPRQFGIIDLVAAITLAALILAIAAPFLRALQQQNLLRFGLSTAGQLLACGIAYAYAAYRRSGVLAQAGNRLAIGYTGTLAWRNWPLTKSITLMLLLAVGQLAFAILFSLAQSPQSPLFGSFVHQIQLGVILGFAIARFVWRVYPGAIEFFEDGVVMGGLSLTAWEQIEIRKSQFFDDRMVIVVRSAVPSTGASTFLVQLPADQLAAKSG